MARIMKREIMKRETMGVADRRVRPLAAARALAGAVLVAFAALLALPLQAEAQTVTTFVSNTGQDRNSILPVSHHSGIAFPNPPDVMQ